MNPCNGMRYLKNLIQHKNYDRNRSSVAAFIVEIAVDFMTQWD